MLEWGKNSQSSNEIDVIAVHHNRMLLVECKSGRFGANRDKAKSTVYKLDSIGRAAGGPFGSRLLFVAGTLPKEERERTRRLRIDVIENTDVIALKEYLFKWMGLSRTPAISENPD